MPKVYRKRNMQFESENGKPCTHEGTMSWSGRLPCTGVYQCRLCGYVHIGAHPLDHESRKA